MMQADGLQTVNPAAGHGRRDGFTLVEVLIATTITLILMALVVTVFATVGDSISAQRAMIEVQDQLRAAQLALEGDLDGATASMLSPLDPEEGQGYLEYVEGPVVERYVPPPGLPATFPLLSAETQAYISTEDKDGNGVADPDFTAGDFDDVLMLTTRRANDVFVGRFNGGAIQSQVAEVAWFMRGNKLYRRVLLVKPAVLFDQTTLTQAGFYSMYDVSARQEGADGNAPDLDRSPTPGPVRIVANSLGDLTRRENRYGHQPYVYPHDINFWGVLRLPTLRETSATDTSQTPDGLWPFPQIDSTGTAWGASALPGGATVQQSNIYPAATDPKGQLIVPGGLATALPPAPATQEYRVNLTLLSGGVFDLWETPYPYAEIDQTGNLAAYSGGLSTRFGEDVILNNVLSFDVKAWDPIAPIITDAASNVYEPGDPDYLQVAMNTSPAPTQISQGAYVDLNYMNDGTISIFSGPGLNGYLPMVYDTWSTHYERDGFDQDLDTLVDEATDGLDNYYDTTNNQHSTTTSHVQLGGVDDSSEMEAPAPYPVPLRGLQIKIRVFEPDSRQIRELTIVHKFLPE